MLREVDIYMILKDEWPKAEGARLHQKRRCESAMNGTSTRRGRKKNP